MSHDRAETAARACEALADCLDAGAASDDPRGKAMFALLSVPNTHPLRNVEVEADGERKVVDRLVEAARVTGSPEATPEELRLLAAELRAGAPEMKARGWYPYVIGGDR